MPFLFFLKPLRSALRVCLHQSYELYSSVLNATNFNVNRRKQRLQRRPKETPTPLAPPPPAASLHPSATPRGAAKKVYPSGALLGGLNVALTGRTSSVPSGWRSTPAQAWWVRDVRGMVKIEPDAQSATQKL